ncbi:MAG: hypothetical protein M0Z28_10355 [Rhodospirillales bacterium]|nr:hypothetical protein [Rhodospirillales bacterium]
MNDLHNLYALVRRYALGIWRWRWLVAGIAWVICLGGWAGVMMIPNQYEANARLYVDADAVLTPLLRGLALDNSTASELDILQRTLLSRPNLEKLISQTDLELRVRGPSDLERLVAGLATAIRLTPQTRNLFTISYRDTHPKLAYDVVQAMLSIFIETKAGTNRSDMENARQFLEQQIGSYEQKLRMAEAQRAAFVGKYMDLLPDANGASRLDAARSAVANLQDALKQARLREELAKQQLAATPATLSTDAEGGLIGPGGSDPLAMQPKACQELDAARVRYTDQNPTVITLKAECDDARRRGEGVVTRGGTVVRGGHAISNPVAEKLRLQIFDLESAIATLQQQIADKIAQRDRLEAVARGAPGVQAQFTDINRDYDVLRKNYEQLIERREAMRIAAAADTEAEKVKLQVVDPPQLPHNPVAPKRILLISMILPVGLAGGIGAAVLLLQFDTSFHTVDELRRIGLPVIGSVSLVTTRASLARGMVSILGIAVVLLLLCATCGGLVLRLMRAGTA